MTIYRVTIRTPHAGDVKGRLEVPAELELEVLEWLSTMAGGLGGVAIASEEPAEMTWPPCVWCGRPTGAGDHRACHLKIAPLAPGEPFLCSPAWLEYMAAVPDHDGMAQFRRFRRLEGGGELEGGELVRVRAVWEPPAAELEALRAEQQSRA